MSSPSHEQNVPIVPCAKEVLSEETAIITNIIIFHGNVSIGPYTHSFSVGKIPWEMNISSESNGDSKISFTCEKETFAMNWGLTAKIKIYFAAPMLDDDMLLAEEGLYADSVGLNSYLDRDPLTYPLNKTIKENFNSHHRSHSVAISNENIESLLPDGWKNERNLSHQLYITVQITIKKSWGLRHRTVITYDFTKPSELSNLVLQIENKQVFVDVRFLSHFSTFFFHYTQGDNMKALKIDSATNLPILLLENVSHDSFLDLLNIIYPCGGAVTVDNVEGLLPVAHYLAFETVLMKCEDFLINQEDLRNHLQLSLYKTFQWSFLYEMSALQNHCLSQMTSSRTMASLKKEPFYEQMTDDVKAVILDRIMTLLLEGR